MLVVGSRKRGGGGGTQVKLASRSSLQELSSAAVTRLVIRCFVADEETCQDQHLIALQRAFKCSHLEKVAARWLAP